MTLTAASPLTALKGVGSAGARILAAAALETVEDLLWYLPSRWEDRSHAEAIGGLKDAIGPVTVNGRLVSVAERRAHRRRLTILEALVEDGSGSLPVVWFNQPYLAATLQRGARVWLYGPLRPARTGWGLQLVSPEWEVEEDEEEGGGLHVGRIVPIYRRIGRISGRRIRTLVARALDSVTLGDDRLAAFLPSDAAMPDRGVALRHVHFPEVPDSDGDRAARLTELAARRSPAQRRLALEELVALSVVIERARAARMGQRAVGCEVSERVRERARRVLPFKLTTAQRRVLAEIVEDLQRPYPMARLLQGDVGSGKTIVATLAAVVVLEAGAQVALLAPTELLAQQHHRTLERLLADAPYRPELLIGSLRGREKRAAREAIATGRTPLVVGTHALIESSVSFARLGLAVIDEQHRFGAAQRQALLDKGEAPHLLVMTATPIPRSLALSVYGDLDVSTLDELPPGRTAVTTVVRDEAARPRLVQFVRREVAGGGQVYWVFPLIEESDAISAKAVETHARVVRRELQGIPVGTVHGQLPVRERDEIMADFAGGRLKVLCATTVIEVGIDVPAASVMVIENAERFGLAQLHQLRGRIGRGRRRSYCVLLVEGIESLEARRRLEVFAATTDGFRIAEEDFKLRGPGEITGLRQWGRPELRMASLMTHRRELEVARGVVASAQSSGRLGELEAAIPPRLRFASVIPSA